MIRNLIRYSAFLLLVAAIGHPQSLRAQNVELIVGEWLEGESVTPSTAAAGNLKSPFGVDFDSTGQMWIVELGGGRVHTLSTDGKLAHVGGDGSKGYAGDGRHLSQSIYNGMHNVAVTKQDEILIADSWNHCVRRIDPRTNVVTTIAGAGKPGYSGDGGPASEAAFNFIMCITLTPDDSKLHIADLKNRRIRQIDLDSGIVRTVAGNGQKGIPQDGSWAIESPLVDPRAVAADSKGNVYILERSGHSLRVVDAKGRIRTVVGDGKAGDADGPGLQARLKSPKHIAIDVDDSVIIADESNRLIRRYDPATDQVTTLLGRHDAKTPIRLSKPHGVCVRGGMLYVVDTGHDRIFRLKSTATP